MNETLTHLSAVLPVLAVLAAVFGFLGWSVRGKSNQPATIIATKAAPSSDKGQQDRAKNLESALEKSKAAHKSLKAELETLQASSVAKTTLETAAAELEVARKTLETETKRSSSLEVDLKKSQDAVRNLNSRANDGEKAQKDRSFALENELSKTREQLAILQNRPDDSAVLNAEIERLRESVAVSTRFAGEMRKREATAVETLEKVQSQLASMGDSSRPAAAVARKIGPVVESGRIAAAKAEVIRLVELNKQKVAEISILAAPVMVAALPAIIEETPVIVEETPAIVEEAPVIVEETPVIVEEAPVIVEEAPVIVEEAPAIVEEAPAIVEETPVIVEEAPVMVEEIPDTLEPIPTSEEDAPEMIEAAVSNIEEASTLSPEPLAPNENAPAPKKLEVASELFALD